MARQNGQRAAQCNTGGRPGERNFLREDLLDFLFFVSNNTAMKDVLRRQVETTQHASIAFGERCKKMGVRPSMSTVGNPEPDHIEKAENLSTLPCAEEGQLPPNGTPAAWSSERLCRGTK
jgi:hypothetical protein